MVHDAYSAKDEKGEQRRYQFRNFDPVKTFNGKSCFSEVTLILLDGSEYQYEFPEPLIETGLNSYRRLIKERTQDGDQCTDWDLEMDLEHVFAGLDERLCYLAELPSSRDENGKPITRDQVMKQELWRKIQQYLSLARQFRQFGSFPDFLTNAGYYLLNLFLLDRAIEEWENIRKYEFGYTELLDFHACMVLILQQIDFLESMDQMVTYRARAAAMAKNKEVRELKDQALAYYCDPNNKFRSRIAAAREISTKIVPVTERTVDAWIKEYEESKTN